MNKEEIEQIINQTFSGLMFFYRDAETDESLISKYETGQIIIERGFVDMASKKCRFSSNLRYLIASAHAKDFSPYADLGHAVLPPGACFKVLDIYRNGDKTQILLLEIPEIPAATVKFFSRFKISLEEYIVAKARENFNTPVNADPLPELQMQEWHERTKSPIGMNDEGVFFDIE
jgi:hypothetical protein